MSVTSKNVTPFLSLYRESARVLWNITVARTKTEFSSENYSNCTVLSSNWKEPSWDEVACFEEVCVHLFNFLVLLPLGLQGVVTKSIGSAGIRKPIPYFTVEPILELKPSIHLQILDDDKDTIRFCDKIVSLSQDESDGLELIFVDLFDYDVLGIRDLEYYEVFINKWPSNPDISGRYALLPFSKGQVFFLRENPL